MGLTSELASWVAAVSLRDLPAGVVKRAKEGILDTLGVILAGADQPAARIAGLAGGATEPVASRLGTPHRTSTEWAALVNGIAGHVLDFDDVSFRVHGHPSVVILPAVLAVAEANRATGAALLEAYVAGVEALSKLGSGLGNRAYELGWHLTAVSGTVASAAAVGRLMGLGNLALANAIAIAASEAAGLRQNFGTMTKSLHVGHAARCGVEAAHLAAAGFTGDGSVLEGPLGYFAVFGQHENDPGSIAESLGAPFELESPGISIKRYPCCYGAHRAIDAVLDALRGHDVDVRDVTGITAVVPARDLVPLVHDRPRNGLEAKFSLRYLLAAALIDRGIVLGSFRDEMVERLDVKTVMELVDVAPSASSARSIGGEGVVRVSIALSTGTVLRAEVADARGSPRRPLDADELSLKFRDCAMGILEPAATEAVIASVMTLESVADVSSLTALLRAGVG